MAPPPEKLYFTTKLAYGAGDLGPAITANILVFFLLFFFTSVAGLPPGLAGSITALSKISDAINDPIIGIQSDRTRTRWGRRIPWILVGTIPFGIFYYLQWIVPQFSEDPQANIWYLFAYYLIVAVLFNIFFTVVNLPYTTLTAELTQDYNERTSLNSFRMAFSIGGSILSLIIAGFIFQAFPGNPRLQYQILGLVCGFIAIISLAWCGLRISERGSQPVLAYPQKKIVGTVLVLLALGGLITALIRFQLDVWNFSIVIFAVLFAAFGLTLRSNKTEPHLLSASNYSVDNEQSLPIKEQLKIAFSNRPFLYVIGIYLCSWLSVQLTASILIYFVVSWIGLPESSFPSVAIAIQGTALVTLFIWQALSQKLGKKTVYFLGTSVWIIAQIGLFLIQPGQVFLMYFLAVLAGIGVSVAYLIPWSMLPDVIELDELQTGQRREGVFYSFMVFLQKLCLALALFLVGLTLEWSGFIKQQAGAEIPIQPEQAILAIRLIVAPFPAIILLIGLVLAYFYPITKEFHTEIRMKLLARKQQI